MSTTPVHSKRGVDVSNRDVQDTPLTNVPGDAIDSLDNKFTPIIWSVDKVSSSIPKKVRFNEDYLRECVGFRRVDTLKKNLGYLYQPTISLENTPADAILDPGCYASMKKKDRSTTPAPSGVLWGCISH